MFLGGFFLVFLICVDFSVFSMIDFASKPSELIEKGRQPYKNEKKMKWACKPGSVPSLETIIHLEDTSLHSSSNLPENKVRATPCLYRNTNLLSYLVLHRMGFTLPRTVTRRAVRSYRTLSPLPANKLTGGLLSAALAISSHCPAVSWHSALWCPDFPPS